MDGGPLVSIVAPTYGRAGLLARMLASVEATVALPHEVICVTVGDDGPTQELLAGAPGVVNLVEARRGGFVRAANAGFGAARGRWVCQLNDDCELMPYAVENAVRFMEAPAHRDVGQAAFFHDTPVRRNIEREIRVEGTRYVVCHVRGLCFANFGLVSRELGDRLGWYDERFFMYGADPDFSLRVWHEAGLRVSPCAGALVRHLEVEDERSSGERRRQGEDNALLFEKWGMSAGGVPASGRAIGQAAAALAPEGALDHFARNDSI
jgi:GT2 family glycosyltransferase